jgi:hypothetical protein
MTVIIINLRRVLLTDDDFFRASNFGVFLKSLLSKVY